MGLEQKVLTSLQLVYEEKPDYVGLVYSFTRTLVTKSVEATLLSRSMVLNQMLHPVTLCGVSTDSCAPDTAVYIAAQFSISGF